LLLPIAPTKHAPEIQTQVCTTVPFDSQVIEAFVNALLHPSVASGDELLVGWLPLDVEVVSKAQAMTTIDETISAARTATQG
jgi:hypothetical protein